MKMGHNKVSPLEQDQQNESTTKKEEFEINEETAESQEPKRDNWSGKLDFFLSALSFSGG